MVPPLLQFLLLTVAGWLNREQQLAIAYLEAELTVLREHIPRKRIPFTDAQRRRLARAAKPLSPMDRRQLANLVTPETLLAWYRTLVAAKYTPARRRAGRPSAPQSLRQTVLRFANENPNWGYGRIQQTLAALGHDISRSTVANILKEEGLEPAPRRGMSWSDFLRAHWGAIAAADFFTVEVVTLHGILRYHVLFVIDLKTRVVEVAGLVRDPHGQWCCNIFRDLTADGWGFLQHHTHLIVDRDPVFTKEMVDMLHHRGLTVVRTPPRSPNLNAYAERFVRSVRQECLRHVMPLGERHLLHVLREYVSHYNGERVHQGIEGRIPASTLAANGRGPIQRRTRLGGLLSIYHREVA